MPRGKALFATGSPNSDFWPDQPEEAMADIADRHNVTYVKDSLIFTPGGRAAEALFKTEESEEGMPESRLLNLAEDLDAWEFRLFVDPDRWRARRQGTQQS